MTIHFLSTNTVFYSSESRYCKDTTTKILHPAVYKPSDERRKACNLILIENTIDYHYKCMCQ